MVLMVLLLLCMSGYLRQTARDCEGGRPMTDRARTHPHRGGGRPPATAARQRRRRGSGMDRKPRVAVAVTVLFFVLLYLPIVAVVLFSFNTKKSLTVFDGWSLQWYDAFLERRRADRVPRDQPPGRGGRDGRLGGHRRDCSPSAWCARRPGSARAANVIMLIPLITPEIVTGVASLMLFKGVGLQPVPDHADDRADDVLDLLRHRDPAGPGRRAQPGDRGGRHGPRRHPRPGRCGW